MCHEDTKDSGVVMEAGGGWFARGKQRRQAPLIMYLRRIDPEMVRDQWDKATDFAGETVFPNWNYKTGKLVQCLGRSRIFKCSVCSVSLKCERLGNKITFLR